MKITKKHLIDKLKDVPDDYSLFILYNATDPSNGFVLSHYTIEDEEEKKLVLVIEND